MSKNPLQKGFIFRQEDCVGCQGCVVNCQLWNELPENVRFRKVDTYEVTDAEGDVRDVWLSHSCMHCDNPTCMAVCPSKAFFKRHDGLVILDRDKCTACGLCKPACPYDAIVISESDGKAAKCNMCIERIEAGLLPACVAGCPVGCLKMGDVNVVLKSDKAARKQCIGYKDGPNGPNMVIIQRRKR